MISRHKFSYQEYMSNNRKGIVTTFLIMWKMGIKSQALEEEIRQEEIRQAQIRQAKIRQAQIRQARIRQAQMRQVFKDQIHKAQIRKARIQILENNINNLFDDDEDFYIYNNLKH